VHLLLLLHVTWYHIANEQRTQYSLTHIDSSWETLTYLYTKNLCSTILLTFLLFGMEAPKEKDENFFKEILKASLIALIIVVPIRFFIAQPFIVSGASMDPAFESGHYLVVDQLSYRFEKPMRGDVIVFKFPRDTSKFFIKRIIGLPGETIQTRDGIVAIINEEFPDGMLLEEPYLYDGNRTRDTFRITLAEDEYFVMGDNRRASSDSRMWGPLNKDLLIGRAYLRVLPLQQIGILPGAYESQY